MNQQCQSCGSFETVTPCAYCPTLICMSCARNHSSLCEELQKSKRRGEGPTIANVPVPQHRRGHEIPEPTPAPRYFCSAEETVKLAIALDAILHQDNMPNQCLVVDCSIDGPHEHFIGGPAQAFESDLDIAIKGIKYLVDQENSNG
jgi:hypothetical protein